jgi:trk system potassium uptake protein TrkA
MKIVIAGVGDIGFYLAKLLEQEYKNIVLIDSQKENLKSVETNLGIATILGDSTSYKTLQEAGVDSCHYFFGFTSSESVNILSCILAKKLGAKHTVARVSNMEYILNKDTLNFKFNGIDDIISPEFLAAREIEQIIKEPSLTESTEIEDGKFKVIGLHLDVSSRLIGKTLAESAKFNPENSFIIAAINRSGKTIIPNGKTIFETGDYLYFISTDKTSRQILEFTGNPKIEIKNLLIVGGSRTGEYLAHRLSKNLKITLIEKDQTKCNELALRLEQIQVVHGDCTNTKLLEEERIGNYNAFVSVTGNSETNLLSCIVAKHHNVTKTIALIENIGLIDYSQNLGIDTLLNKKLAAVNFLFKKIIKGNKLSFLIGIDAEILEFNIKQNSKFKGCKIKDLNFPEHAIIGGVVRNENGYITLGDFEFRENDKLIVFSLPQSVKKVQSMFQ